MSKSTTTQETLAEKEQLLLDEINMLCTMIEGKLATSTTEFIDKNINKIKNLKTYHKDSIIVVSLITRLTNIKEELLKKQK